MFECLVPVGETIWEELGMAMLEKVCHLGWALKFQKPTSFPVSSFLCLWIRCKLAIIAPAMPACLPLVFLGDGHGL